MQFKAIYPLFVFLAAIAMLFSAGQIQAADKPDVVYINGKIYTVNDAQAWVEAMAIKDGKFLKVGSKGEVLGVADKSTKVVDLGGKFVMPGIHDTHVHPVSPYLDEEAGWLALHSSMTKEEIERAIREYAKAYPGDGWIRGEGWGVSLFPGGKATKDWLDGIVSDRPAVLLDETGHNAVANSQALAKAGISKDTPNPSMGVIVKDPKTGEATGFLGETGVGLVLVHSPAADRAVHKRALSRALAEMSAYGITSFVDMGVWELVLSIYKELEEQGELPFRVDAAIMMNDYRGDLPDPDPVLAVSNEYDTRLIDPHNVKYWADGTPFTFTSLLLEPYTNDPTTRGELTVSQEQLNRFVELDRKGLTIHVHAVTDGTVRAVLDAIEKARKANPGNSRSHHIGHLAVVNPGDVPRFKALNVNAEFSPAMWYPMSLSEVAVEFVGEERMKRWQPIKELMDSGANVSYGSDWPSGTPDADCWRGLEGMVTRRDPTGKRPGQIGTPIDLASGIRMLTINGARTMHREDQTGSIETGKYADFIVLDRNLFEIPADQIADAKVVTTVFEGKVVYRSSEKSNARIDRQRKAMLAELPSYTHLN